MPLSPDSPPIVNSNLPAFPINPDSVKILHTPDEFYQTLLSHIQQAQERIVLSTLYIGTDSLSVKLVDAVREACEKRNVQVLVLIDASRGLRHTSVTRKYAGFSGASDSQSDVHVASSSCDLLLPLTALDGVSVALYHNPTLRGWLRLLLPERIKEVLGVHHVKAYVFDDSVLISGANLSQDYFVNRQDRYWLFNRERSLADFYADLIHVISRFCYRLSPDGSLKPQSSATDPLKVSLSDYKRDFCRAVTDHMTRWRLSHPPQSKHNTFVYPLLQFGPMGIRTEEQLTTRLLSSICCPTGSVRYHVSLVSGYFNLTKRYQDLLLDHTRVNGNGMLELLCAGPRANGFFNSPGLSGYIPLAYRESLIRLCSRFAKTHNPPQLPRVMEYCAKGWTFHSKGLWVSKLDSNTRPKSSVTLIGSSNFSYRSLNRDLESQLAVWTENDRFQRQMAEEREYLFSPATCSPVTLAVLINQRHLRLPWYLRFLYPVTHTLM